MYKITEARFLAENIKQFEIEAPRIAKKRQADLTWIVIGKLAQPRFVQNKCIIEEFDDFRLWIRCQ